MQAPSSPSFSLEGIELSLAGTLGVTFICLNVAVFVTGITSLQAMQYFSRYKHDGWYNKLSVTLLWLLDLTNTLFIVLAGYRYFVIWYGNPAASMEVHIFLKTVVWTASTEICLVHILYSLRIWKLSRKQWPLFGGTVVVFVISCAIGASAFSDYGFSTIGSFFDTHEVHNPYYFWVPNLTATILDVILAATLLVYVKPKDTTFANAHSVVTTLLMYTIASGAATGLCSAVGLITFFRLPHTLVFVGSMFVMTKLYATSYLQLVCSRKRWRDKLAKPNMDMWEWEEDPPKLSSDSERPMLRSGSPWSLIKHGRSDSRASTLIGFSK